MQVMILSSDYVHRSFVDFSAQGLKNFLFTRYSFYERGAGEDLGFHVLLNNVFFHIL